MVLTAYSPQWIYAANISFTLKARSLPTLQIELFSVMLRRQPKLWRPTGVGQALLFKGTVDSLFQEVFYHFLRTACTEEEEKIQYAMGKPISNLARHCHQPVPAGGGLGHPPAAKGWDRAVLFPGRRPASWACDFFCSVAFCFGISGA